MPTALVIVIVILGLAILAMLILVWSRLREMKEAITHPQTAGQGDDAMELMEAESVTSTEAMTRVAEDVAALRASLDQAQLDLAELKAALVPMRATMDRLSMYVAQVLDSRMQRG